MAETFVLDGSGKPTILKDPNAVLDYTFDWTAWLAGDTLVSIDSAVSGSIGANISAQYFSGQKATIWVQGGTSGSKIALRCRIVTLAGRVDDRTVYLKIKER